MILSTLRSLHFRWFPVFPLKTCAIDASPILHKTVSMCPIDRSGAVAMIFVKLCYILSSSSSVLILTETTSQFEGLNFCCIRRSQSQCLLCEVKVSYILNWEGKSISKLKIIFLWGCLPHGICYRMNAYNIIHRQLTQESMLPPLPSCSIVSWIHEGIADYRTAGGTSTKRKYQSKEERKSKESKKIPTFPRKLSVRNGLDMSPCGYWLK